MSNNVLLSKNVKVRKFRDGRVSDSKRSASAKRRSQYMRSARATKRSQYSV